LPAEVAVVSATGRRTYRSKRGRKVNGPPFIQLHHYLVDSDAWHQLSLPARAAYIELARLYNGVNNGMIIMSVRTLAVLVPCNKDTAGRALTELELAGFIKPTKIGTFHRKQRHATKYRLTCYRDDRTGELPTKDFYPAKRQAARSEIFGQTVRTNRTDDRQRDVSVRNGRTVGADSDPSTVRTNRTHLESYHRPLEPNSPIAVAAVVRLRGRFRRGCSSSREGARCRRAATGTG
jgi:hypothetical protein